jgi:hypothetical protein
MTCSPIALLLAELCVRLSRRAGDNIVEHIAGVDDFETAVATYRAACLRWPNAKITLRQGARVVVRNWRE